VVNESKVLNECKVFIRHSSQRLLQKDGWFAHFAAAAGEEEDAAADEEGADEDGPGQEEDE